MAASTLVSVYDDAGAARRADLHAINRGLSNLIVDGWPDAVVARHWAAVRPDVRDRVARVWPEMAAALDALV